MKVFLLQTDKDWAWIEIFTVFMEVIITGPKVLTASKRETEPESNPGGQTEPVKNHRPKNN